MLNYVCLCWRTEIGTERHVADGTQNSNVLYGTKEIDFRYF